MFLLQVESSKIAQRDKYVVLTRLNSYGPSYHVQSYSRIKILRTQLFIKREQYDIFSPCQRFSIFLIQISRMQSNSNIQNIEQFEILEFAPWAIEVAVIKDYRLY